MEANSFPPVVSILSTGPMPVSVIEAFRKASTTGRLAKYAYPTVPSASEKQRKPEAKAKYRAILRANWPRDMSGCDLCSNRYIFPSSRDHRMQSLINMIKQSNHYWLSVIHTGVTG